MFCYKCGQQIDDEAVVCPHCGCATKNYTPQKGMSGGAYGVEVSEKSRLVALLLCIFLGCFGVHRFYLGKIGTGIIWLFTFGCLGIGTLIDVILIACGSMKDKNGFPVAEWN